MAIVPISEIKEEINSATHRKEQRIYEGLKEEEFAKLLEKTKKEIHRIAFILAYGSGLRVSEVLKLEPSDIDFSGKKIFIRQAKGRKDRVVNIPKWLREKHLKYLPLKTSVKTRALEKAFHRASYSSGINRIIGTYSRGGKNIPVHRFHFHSLRNSFATRALESGVPPNQVQLLMGHSSLQTTTRYTKANPIDAIQSIINKGV